MKSGNEQIEDFDSYTLRKGKHRLANKILHFNESEASLTAKKFQEKLHENAKTAVLESLLDKGDTTDYELYQNDIAAWEKLHAPEIKAAMAQMGDTVALLNSSKIQSFVTKASDTYFFQKDEFNANGNYKEDTRSAYMMEQTLRVEEQFGKDLYNVIFDNHKLFNQYFSSRGDGTLDYQAASFAANQTFDRIEDAVKNVKDKGYQVFMYDTETTGGRALMLHGQDGVLAQRITELNFSKLNLRGENGVETLETYNSIIGSTDQEFQYFQDLIGKYRKGEAIASDEMVTLQRLALMGNSTVGVDEALNKEGIFRYSSFAGPEQIANMDWADMQAGAEQLYEIGKKQRANLVTFNGHQMQGWEKEYLRALHDIRKGDYTVAGHNIIQFDDPKMNYLAHNMATAGGQKAMDEFLGGHGKALEFAHEADTLPMTRLMLDLDKSLTPEDHARMNAGGHTSNQLEILTPHIDPHFYENRPAHMANTDSEANGLLFNEIIKVMDGEKSSFIRSNQYGDYAQHSFKLKGDSTQLFVQKQHVDPGKYRLMGFVKDDFSKSLRTFAGNRLDNLGGRKELFAQTGAMPGVAYTISGIQRFETTEEYSKAIEDINPNMDVGELYAVTINPVTEGVNTSKATNSITYVGSKADLQRAIMDNMAHAGDKVDGEWTDSKMSQYERDALARIYNDGDAPSTKKYSVDDVIKISSYRMKNESAARMARSHQIKKDEAAVRYVEAKEKYVAENIGNELKPGSAEYKAKEQALKDQFDATVKADSEAYESKLRSGQKVTKKDVDGKLGTYHSFFGYREFTEGSPVKNRQVVYTETKDSELMLQDYAAKNRTLIKAAAERARKRAGSEGNLAAQYYNQYMSAAYTAAQDLYGEHSKEAGFENIGRYAFELENTFDVDMSNFTGADIAKGPFSVWQSGEGLGLGNSIARYLGKDPDRTSDGKKKVLLGRLQEYMKSSGVITDEEFYKSHLITPEDSLHDASLKIMQITKNERAKNPYAGILKDTFHHQILANVDNFGLSEEQINSVMDVADQTIPELKPSYDKLHQADKNEATATQMRDALFQKVSDDELRKAGYDEQAIKKIKTIREIRSKDTLDLMNNIVDEFRKFGGSFAISNGEVFAVKGGKQLKLNLPKDRFKNGMFVSELGTTNLLAPIGLFDKKQADGSTKLKMMSLIGKAKSEAGSLHYKLAKWDKEGDVLHGLEQYISGFNQTMRKAASAMDLDAMDWANQFNFSYHDVIGHLNELRQGKVPYLHDSDFSQDGYGKLLKDTLDKLEAGEIKKGEKTLSEIDTSGELSYDLKMAINHNLWAIHNAMRSYSEDYRDLSKNGTFEIKKSAKEQMALYRTTDVMEEYGNLNRGANEALARSMKFNADRAAKGMEDHGGIQFGRAVTYKDINAHMTRNDGLAHKTETVARLNRVAMESHDVNEIVQLAAKNQRIRDYGSFQMLSMVSTYEGSTSMSGYVFDYVFNRHHSEQKINVDDLVNPPAGQEKTLLKQMKAAPKIREMADGSYSFRYSNGAYVLADETVGYKKGLIKDEPKAVTAKNEGVMKMGFFNDENILVDEESINQLLNTKEVKEKLAKVSEDDRQKMAYQILQKKFTRKFYIENFDLNDHLKLGEVREKGMTNALMVGLGGLNDSDQNLKHKGFEVNETSRRIGNVAEKLGLGRNRLLSIEALENFGADNIANTTLGVIINGRRAKKHLDKLDDAGIRQIIQGEGFGSAQDFLAKAKEERYRPTEDFDMILHDNKLMSDGKKFQIISGHQQKGAVKHSDVTGFNQLAAKLLDKYKDTPDKALEIMNRALPGLGLQLSEDKSRFLMDRNYSDTYDRKINFSKIQQVAYDEFGVKLDDDGKMQFDSTHETEVNGRTIRSSETIDEYSQAETHDIVNKGIAGERGADKALKLNFRHQAALRNITGGQYIAYDKETGKKRIMDGTWYMTDESGNKKQAISNLGLAHKGLIEDFGEEKGKELFDKYLKELAEPLKDDKGNELGYRAIGKGVADQIQDAIYDRMGDRHIMEARLDKEGNVRSRILTHAFDNFLQTEGIEGDAWTVERDGKTINAGRETAYHVMQEAQKRGIKNFGDSALSDHLQAYYGALAQNFNTYNGSIKKEHLEQNGFKVVNIMDAVTDGAGAGKVKESIYGKNILLDLKNDVTGEMLYNGDGSKRYVALPYVPLAKGTDEDYMFDQSMKPYQEDVRRLQNILEDYTDKINNNTPDSKGIDEAGRERIINNAVGQVRQIRDDINKMVRDKHGTIKQASTARMGDAIRSITHAYYGGNTLKEKNLLNGLTYRGIDLAAENAKGEAAANFDIAFQSAAVMEDIYHGKLKTMAKLGMSEDDLKDFSDKLNTNLRTKGVETIYLREPVQYRGSIGPSQVYLSDSIKQSDATWHAILGAEIRKEDNDSDATTTAFQHFESIVDLGNGKKKVMNLDSASYDTLKDLEASTGGRISVNFTEQGQARYNDSFRYQLYMGQIMKMHKSAEKGLADNLFQANKKYGDFTIDGTTDGVMAGRIGLVSPEQRMSYLQTYADLQRNTVEAMGEGGEEIFSKMSMAEQHKAMFNQAMKSIADRGLNDTESDAEVKRFSNAIAYNIEQHGQALTADAFGGKSGAGLMNYHTQGLLHVIQESGQYNDKELSDVMQVVTGLQEGFLSAKNNSAVDPNDEFTFQKMKTIGDAMKQTYNAARGNGNIQQRAEAQENLRQVLEKSLLNDDRMGKEMGKLIGMSEINDMSMEELQKNFDFGNEAVTLEQARVRAREERVKEAIRTVSSVATRVDLSGVPNDALSVAISRGSASTTGEVIKAVADDETYNQQTLSMINAVAAQQHLKEPVEIAGNISGTIEYRKALQTAAERKEAEAEAQKAAARADAEAVTKNAEAALSKDAERAKKELIGKMNRIHMPKGGKAAALIGIASGLMVSGYLHDPTEASAAPPPQQQSMVSVPGSADPGPTDTMAAEAQNVYAGQYPSAPPMQLSDSNLNVMRGTPNQSYVINISAQSPRGQAAAQQAVQGAIGGTLPQNGTINMTMNTGVSDQISQLQLNRMIQHALN